MITKRRTALRCAGALGVAVLLLTGCSGVVGAGSAAMSDTGAAPPAPEPISWSGCGPNLECATVEVPLEYSDPEGEQIPLSVMRHRATDPAGRIGSLFFNPGGPGVPASDTMRGLGTVTGAPGTFSPDVLARFDVIGMDPRGVGGSGAVRCLTDEQRVEAADADPAVPGGKPLPELLADATTFTEGCAAEQSTALLASMSTDNVARDIDHIRAALGEEQITYYGISYGTVVGPMYATLFPDRVRQMVLDAPVDTGLWHHDTLRLLDDVAVASEATLDAWFATCRAEGVQACPFGAGDPESAFDALITQLEAQPLQVPPTEGRPGGAVDGYAALEAARGMAGDRATWPLLTAGLVAAQQGDGSLLHLIYGALTVSPFPVHTAMQEQHVAVRCADWDIPTDVAEHTAAAERVVAENARIGTRAAYAALTCALWPAPNEDRVTGPLTGAGAPQILVVGGELDPVSPHHWAVTMAQETLDSAVLLTREGVGHGSYGTVPCVDAAVDATLIDGRLPADGTVCTPETPATTDLTTLTAGN
jgi:pimeloyl-ACP methyl ester carboxylesterase